MSGNSNILLWPERRELPVPLKAIGRIFQSARQWNHLRTEEEIMFRFSAPSRSAN